MNSGDHQSSSFNQFPEYRLCIPMQHPSPVLHNAHAVEVLLVSEDASLDPRFLISVLRDHGKTQNRSILDYRLLNRANLLFRSG